MARVPRLLRLALSRPKLPKRERLQHRRGEPGDGSTCEEDVEVLQQLKQHHVHNPPKKTRRSHALPLDHCRDSKEDPTKCKAGFPRETSS